MYLRIEDWTPFLFIIGIVLGILIFYLIIKTAVKIGMIKADEAIHSHECPYCKALSPNNAKFCKECGKSLSPRTVICSNCGEVNGVRNNYCINCGGELPDDKQRKDESVINQISDELK